MKTIQPYPWQIDCFQSIANNDSARRILVSAPTASGKTLIAYLMTGLGKLTDNRVTFNHKVNQRVIFTAPIKALSHERYRELTNLGFSVGLITGDVKMNQKAPILCMTQEIYTNRYCKRENQFVIIDEVHYMYWDPDRFRAYADGIFNTHPDNQVLLLSATISDRAVEILEKLCGTLSQYRYELRCTYDFLPEEQNPIDLLNAGKDILFFVFSYRGINDIAAKIAKHTTAAQTPKEVEATIACAKKYGANYGKFKQLTENRIGVYHSGLLLKERKYLEELFRHRLIQCLVATNSLAMGVNLPAEYVLFGQLAMYYDNGPIGKSNFLHMSGRAGRPGFHKTGFVSYSRTPFEARGYHTGKIFHHLVEAELEEPDVPIEVNIRNLLTERVSVEEEYEFLHRLDPTIRLFSVQKHWQQTLTAIHKEINQTTSREQIRRDVFQMLCRIYSQELEIEENVNFAYLLVQHGVIDADKVLKQYRHDAIDGKLIHRLLKYFKFFRTLGKRVANIARLEQFINQVDHHYLNP